VIAPQASLPDSPPKHLCPSPDRIPAKFTARPQWVNWRYEERDGDLTKVPYTPGAERRASTTELMTWRTFEEAVAAYETGRYDGIGFVFCSADPFVGIDLDNCRDPESGEIEPWAQEIIDSVTDRYVEASPSGRGVHVITRGTLKDGVNTKWIEVYGQDRYLTMTGALL
jgi:putative DNA primase/helicase